MINSKVVNVFLSILISFVLKKDASISSYALNLLQNLKRDSLSLRSNQIFPALLFQQFDQFPDLPGMVHVTNHQRVGSIDNDQIF